MSFEILFLLSLVCAGWILTAILYYRECQKSADFQRWLTAEIQAHDKTRGHLREAAARMRRENRDRALGVIEAQRVK